MKKFSIGPATLVAAAFIGPGTITLCTLAGAGYGYSLLWALLFSIITTILLQEMAARLGFITKNGLGEALRSQLSHPILRNLAIILVLSAIVLGNAAYEAGNISGAVLGLQPITGDIFDREWICLLIAGIAFMILYVGKYKVLERTMVGLVVIMSLCFILTAILTKPHLPSLFKGLFIPEVNNANLLMIMGLIGTTVVPYNLFLHASLVNEKWKDATLKDVKTDTIISIALGGVVSMAVLVCAAALLGSHVESASDMAVGLEPLLGEFALITISVGLFAAGITSAITAPLAAAYAASGILGLDKNVRSGHFRFIWIIILASGLFFSLTRIKPIEIIQFAQIANAILLPLIAAFLLWIVNNKNTMGFQYNTPIQNILGIVILFITIGLGWKSILLLF